MVSGPRQTTAAPEDFSTLVRHQAQVIEEPPVLPGFSIDIAHSPIRNSSGDFYQSIRLQGQHEGSILIVIGDVSGCGGRTSAAVAEIVRTVRALAVDFRGPGALLAQLNSRIGGCLCGESATCLALFLTPDGNCTVASAGHPWPVVNGRELALESGLPLGLLSESEFPEKHLILREYDYLALYTNGLLEARNQ